MEDELSYQASLGEDVFLVENAELNPVLQEAISFVESITSDLCEEDKKVYIDKHNL